MVKKVFICSPYAPVSEDPVEREKELEENKDLALCANVCAVTKGNIPYAPHLYFPQFLDDSDPDQRDIGMLMGLQWLKECDEIWVIGERTSKGMEKEILQAQRWGIPIRHLSYQYTTR
jgi:hypothetical protein